MEEIGQGAFGKVFKAVWRGTVVAAKEVRSAGNQKMLENELSVYRYDNLHNCSFCVFFLMPPFFLKATKSSQPFKPARDYIPAILNYVNYEFCSREVTSLSGF